MDKTSAGDPYVEVRESPLIVDETRDGGSRS